MNQIESFWNDVGVTAFDNKDANGNILQIACNNGSVFTANYAPPETLPTPLPDLPPVPPDTPPASPPDTPPDSPPIPSSPGPGGPSSPFVSSSPSICSNGPCTATLSWSCPGSTSSTGINFSTGGAINGSAQVTPSQTTTYSVACNGSATVDTLVSVQYPQPGLMFTAAPVSVHKNASTALSWGVTNAVKNSCSITEQGGNFTRALSNASSDSGSIQSPGITATTVFTLSCTGLDGSSPSVSATASLIPSVQEI